MVDVLDEVIFGEDVETVEDEELIDVALGAEEEANEGEVDEDFVEPN